MTLIHHPGSDHQMAVITIDAGMARDITLMLADAHAVIDDLASGQAPAAARQGSAALGEASSPCTLATLAPALDEVGTWLHWARRGALAGIPPLT
ncbi:MAG: hypothetical protein ACRDOD_11145 [Streptosporangiaceae bacterium]